MPQDWILLVPEPALSASPGGDATEKHLQAKSSAKVSILERREAGPEKAPWVKVKVKEREGWLPEAFLSPPPTEISKENIAKIGSESVDRYHGIPARYVPPDLVGISSGAGDGEHYHLRREAAAAFEKMRKAAKSDKVHLEIVSGYRSYETQRSVYLEKLKRSGWKQTTVAKPGHSEHQLGTAVDLSDGNEDALLEEKFSLTAAGKWLLQHAPEFGFAISYTKANQSKTGYSPEPWHYRYVGPELARSRHDAALAGN